MNDRDDVQPWEEREREQVYSGPIFTVHKSRARSASRSVEHVFDILESADWVNVIALTRDGRVVLVRQFRHGTKSVTLEIPGGVVEPGESTIQAAQRELAEETGYRAERWEELGMVEPNPAFQTNRTYTYLARDARLAGPAQPDENEEIEVQTTPLADLPGLLSDGSISHALVFCAFAHLALRGLLELSATR